MNKELLLILSLQSICLFAAEEAVDKHQQLSYSDQYPVLAEGFELIGQDFESHMQQQVSFIIDPNDESLLDSSGRTAASVCHGLENALLKSETIITENCNKVFKNVILQAIKSSVEIDLNNLNEELALLWKLQDPRTCPDDRKLVTFMYIMHYKDSLFFDTFKKYINNKNSTALVHEVVLKNKVMILQFLLSIGLDANKVNRTGFTPLHLAALFNSERVA